MQGESGANNADIFDNAEDAISAFEKKFKDKTKNNWDDRDNFVAHPKKYTMLEIGELKKLFKSEFSNYTDAKIFHIENPSVKLLSSAYVLLN